MDVAKSVEEYAEKIKSGDLTEEQKDIHMKQRIKFKRMEVMASNVVVNFILTFCKGNYLKNRLK